MHLSMILQVVFLLSLIYQPSHAEWQHNIYVSPSGNDSKSCGERLKPCQSLHYVFSFSVQSFNSTRIIAAKGNYTLLRSRNFTNVYNFSLFGNGSRPEDVLVTCEVNVSMSFVLSQNIVLQGVKLHNCGGWHESTVGEEKAYQGLQSVKFKTALDFRYCRSVKFVDVHIYSSPGLGANFYDVGGVVNFTNCVFADNKAPKNGSNETLEISEPKYVYSGGGLFLILNLYGYDTVNVTPAQHDSYQHNNTYVFINSHFLRNKALWLNSNEVHDLTNTPQLSFSRGGGLAIFFWGNASGNTVKVKSCLFIGNLALWGGGLQIELKDRSYDNYVTVADTIFQNNVGHSAGGGVRIGNVLSKDANLPLNRFKLHNCSFLNNSALWGGGTSLYATSILSQCTKRTDPSVTQFVVNRCHWHSNKGTIGAAVGLSLYNQNEDQIGPETPYHVVFNASKFVGNKVVQLQKQLTIGQGAVYSVQVPLTFQGNVTFSNNDNSALALDGSTIEIHDHLDFIDNQGYRGGAVAMYGRSKMVFHEDSKVVFQGNKCKDKGGALYVQVPGPPLVSFNATTQTSNPLCFFGYSNSSLDYNEWRTTLVFQDNTAPGYYALGDSIYATTLKNCRKAGESRQNNSVLHWKFIKYKNLPRNYSSLQSEVATDPVDMKYNVTDWEVAPSEVFNATVELIDEIGNSVFGVINVTISSQKKTSVALRTPSSLFLTNGTITNLTLGGKGHDTFSVTLSFMGNVVLEKTTPEISLKPCYPGFSPSKDIHECVCNDSKGIATCSWDKKTVFLKQGYWAGTVGNDTFVTYFCPDGYCSTTKLENKYHSGSICNENRNQTSVLCGKCRSNFSVMLGNEQCSKKCSNWYLLLMLAYGLVLLLLVMGVMLINLDFFTGYLNAWLYSYQVMSLLTPNGFKFDHFIEFLIGLANFRIKVGSTGICFSKNLDDADKLVAMYVLPTYILVVVMLLSRVVRAYPNWCFSRRVKAPFRAVCTIFVLCYTDITRISLKILRPAKIGDMTVLYANGSIDFFTNKHIGYGILAILYIMMFVLPFPLILMFRPILTKCLRPVLNLNRWKLVLDALQSCFKDEYRWCAAFYFLCRLVLLAIDTYMPMGPLKRALLQGACVLILMTLSYLRPYKDATDVDEDEESYEWINKSDVALLTTLSFIAVFSSPIDSNVPENSDVVDKGLTVFIKVLSYIPLLVLVLVVYRVVRKYFEALWERESLPGQGAQSPRSSDISPEPTTD